MKHEHVQEAAAYVRGKLPRQPSIGIILGSGLGDIADEIESKIVIPYREIPHFACSTAPGHKGQLICGTLSNADVLCMQGRLHYYEGHSMQDILFPIRVMKLLGIETLIVTNAAGGVNLEFHAGDLMLIEDHINFLPNPLIGPNDAEFGPRFCDMTYTYTPALRELAQQAAQKMNISLRRGVYMAVTGPSFETPAEIRAFRTLGADAVGMSTVPEVIAASHCGMQVLAFSLITNMAAGVTGEQLSEEEVIEIGSRQGHVLRSLVTEIVAKL